MAETGRISTKHGEVAYRERAPEGPETGAPVLFVHGNSCCKEAFDRQFVPGFAPGRRLISMDLPGHGQSSDAPDPVATYAIDGFAEAALELLAARGISKAVLVGWSLGGHIVLEMAAAWPGAAGVVITGTPPIGGNPDDMAAAFLPGDDMALTFKPDLSEEEITIKAHTGFGLDVPLEDWMVEAVRRADGRFRSQMIEAAMSGRGRDQKEIAASLDVPLAVFHGTEDLFINPAYLKSLTYKNLWRGAVQEFKGIGHAPFWQDAAAFNSLLGAFLAEVD